MSSFIKFCAMKSALANLRVIAFPKSIILYYKKTVLVGSILLSLISQPLVAKDTPKEIIAPLEKAFQICLKKLSSLKENENIRLNRTVKKNGYEALISLGVKNDRKLCQFGMQDMNNDQSLKVMKQLLESEFGSNLNAETPKLNGIIAEWNAEYSKEKYQFAVLDYNSITLSFAASMMIIYRDLDNK